MTSPPSPQPPSPSPSPTDPIPPPEPAPYPVPDPGDPIAPPPDGAAAGLTRAPGQPFADRRDAGRALGAALAGTLAGDAARARAPARGSGGRGRGRRRPRRAARRPRSCASSACPGSRSWPWARSPPLGDAVETVRIDAVLAAAGVDDATFAAVRERELAELRRREAAYRAGRAGGRGRPRRRARRRRPGHRRHHARRRCRRAAGRRPASHRRRRPGRLARARCASSVPLVDEVVCLLSPPSFRAVGQAYGDFAQTTDDEVRRALAGRR